MELIPLSKIEYGQFFTTTNPFDIDIFYQWMGLFYTKDIVFLEPFAGACNICKMIYNIGYDNEWICYDIEPPEQDDYEIIQQDTINNFPQGFNVAITNPPYLYKSSAKRKGLDFPDSKYDDLYKLSLDVMLKNLDYVAAIVPESFITSELFHNRLYAIISLPYKMFDDTECPVCLALFTKESDDFFIYRNNDYIGTYSELKDYLIPSSNKINWKMNDKHGSIGIKCIDNTKENSICFVKGDSINKDKISSKSRSITRVSGLPDDINLDDFIDMCNDILNQYRQDTSDIFLTAFKGLRSDGLYRRRLDYKTAKDIMNLAINKL